MNDQSARFTGRAAQYAQGRPSYPPEIVDALQAQGLPPGGLVVDIGAGTGIASRLFLDRGYQVIAIEPNPDMRAAALAAAIDARDGRAEATFLPSASADLVLCAQAFHWTDRPSAWAEFQRVAKPNALLALVWNTRITSGTPFLDGLEPLLYHHAVTDPHSSEGADLRQWPGTTEVEIRHSQLLDWPRLLARVASMSFMPRLAAPGYEPMRHALRALYDQTNENGQVEILYACRLYWARNAQPLSHPALEGSPR